MGIKQTNARSSCLVFWYRPPTSSVDEPAFENLREALGILDQEGKGNQFGWWQTVTLSVKNANANKLQFVYSEYEMEQLIETYARVAVTTVPNGEKNLSKSLTDNFSTLNLVYVLKTDILEIGMVDHYLVFGIRKVNAWWYKRENKKPILSSLEPRRTTIVLCNLRPLMKGMF